MWFRKIQATLLILFVPLLGLYLYSESSGVPIRDMFFPQYTIVHIGDMPIKVSVANTPELREKGLSGTKKLADDEGMLFIFDESDYHGIWMKDMNFPIDIVWIGDDKKVIGITEGAQPNSYPHTIFEPPKPARYVLELNEDFADSFSVTVGDQVTLPLEYR